MRSLAPASSPRPVAPVPLAIAASRRDTVALGESIAGLAARLHAATYELLVLLREFDTREGWNNGFLSCAHWLHWRTGIDLGAAREKVRVARALAVLPRVSAAMQRGELSFAKVRALTRVATPDTEVSLLDVALAGTAAHVERVVRAWRRIDAATAARETEARHQSRHLTTWVDADGMVGIRGRLTPELGAVVQRALEAAADRLFRAHATAPTDTSAADEITPGQRLADALGLLAECALATDLDGGTAGDRYQVVVHVEAPAAAPVLAARHEGDVPLDADARPSLASTAKAEPGAYTRPDAVDPRAMRGSTATAAPNAVAAGALTVSDGAVAGGALEVGDGAVYVAAETSRRLACDASVITVRHDPAGAVLDVGRKTRSIPPAIRRALAARDRRCRFPGCAARRCDAHHIEHWADGGATRLDNLVLLCRRHHRLVHEGGVRVVIDADGSPSFQGPHGRRLATVPPTPVDDLRLDDHVAHVATPLPVWDGTPLDLVWAMDVLYVPPAGVVPGR